MFEDEDEAQAWDDFCYIPEEWDEQPTDVELEALVRRGQEE